MTLGCGGYGGNITSDNISPRHLLNIKRLAYEVTPTVSRWDRAGGGASAAAASAGIPLPAAPARPAPAVGISADALTRRIDDFLGSRGYRNMSAQAQPARHDPGPAQPADQKPLDFVCEDDVRRAIHAGKKLIVSERAIVTPAARDLGEQHRVFTFSPFRG